MAFSPVPSPRPCHSGNVGLSWVGEEAGISHPGGHREAAEGGDGPGAGPEADRSPRIREPPRAATGTAMGGGGASLVAKHHGRAQGCPGHLGRGVPPKRLTPRWPSGVMPSVGNWGPLDTRSLPPELQPGLQGHEPAVIESLIFPSRASGLEAACFPTVAS